MSPWGASHVMLGKSISIQVLPFYEILYSRVLQILILFLHRPYAIWLYLPYIFMLLVKKSDY